MNKQATFSEQEQAYINTEILSSLQDILEQNRKIIEKIDEQNGRIDNLEHSVTKKATTAGAISGAVAGGVSCGLVMACMEFVKSQFGG